MTTRFKEDFRGLQRSTLINLRSLPVCGTQLDAMQCRKLLARRMHVGSLWLDKEYPIHVYDIHHLTRLLVGGNAVNTMFQAGTKRAKKEGENDYYGKYGTK